MIGAYNPQVFETFNSVQLQNLTVQVEFDQYNEHVPIMMNNFTPSNKEEYNKCMT